MIDENTLVGLRRLAALLRLGHILGNLDLLDAVGLGRSYRTIPLGVGDIDASILDSRRSCLLSDALDIVGLVCDVDQIDVDQIESNLLQFGVDVGSSQLEERVSILVDLLDGQRSDRQTELTEDDLSRHLFDLIWFELQ